MDEPAASQPWGPVMSCMRCDKCSGIVDTDFDPDSLYVSGRDCLCKWCRDGAAPDEDEGRPRRMPPNIDALIAAEMAADPRYGCKECDWDVDGCSPCEQHADC